MPRERKLPVSLRISEEDKNRLHILNLLPKYPKHQVKSKFFSLLIKDRCDFLREELSNKDVLTETEAEVLKELNEYAN